MKTPISNSKEKRSFGQKLKNFFKVDIEKDLQEEESTKKFERVKLFKLTRTNLFLGLLFFLVIVNLLVGFDLNFLYLRQILGFLFLIAVPGLLIMLCFKIRSVGFWEYLVYTIGLSVAFIMFAGLAVNWTLPLLNITDKPLSLYPILICFDIFLIILGIVAWSRNKDLEHEFTTPKLDAINNVFFVIPMLFPILSILGAFLLNNHGPNILTMIMLGGIAVYVLLLVIFRKKLNENIWPWALWMIGVSLLLMWSMRSWFVVGFDINQEMKVAKLVLLNNHWAMNLFQDPYNSCLSLSIFSPIINIFSNIKMDLIFKLIIQVLFSALPVVLYLIYKKMVHKKVLIFLACFFFISQIFFITQMPALIRQEIAYIFFALFFLLLFSEKTIYKTVLLFIFGFSIIVSHYSTSYIFLFSLLAVYLATIFIRKIPKYKKEIIPLFSLTLLIILLIFGFLWTFQVTQTSSGLANTIHSTITNVGQIFNQESKSGIIQSLMFKKINYYNLYSNYSNNIALNYQNNSEFNLLQTDQDVQYKLPIIKNITNYGLYKISYNIKFVTSIYFKLLIMFGIIICFIFIKEFERKDYFIYAIFYLLTLLLIAILPYISFSYNFERAFLQTLIFLSIMIVYAGYKLFILIFRKENYSIIILSALLILFLIFSSLLVPFFFFGGTGKSIIFENSGDEFNKFYTSNSEVNSLQWINFNSQNGIIFYFDRYSQLKVLSVIPAFEKAIFKDITPKTIDKNSYVFSSYSNKLGYSTVYYRGVLFNINFPREFLNNNKNKIYNNGGSEIFK